MPAGNTLRALDSGGSYEQIALAAGTGQTISVREGKVMLLPAASGTITVQTINTGLNGMIRIEHGGSVNTVTLVDDTGNLELGGSNVALAAGEAALLERRETASGTVEFALVAEIKK